MRCPNCSNDASDHRLKLLVSRKLRCAACGERLYAVDDQARSWVLIGIGALLIAAAALVAYFDLLVSDTFAMIGFKRAAGIIAFAIVLYYFRPYRLAMSDSLDQRTKRKHDLIPYAQLIVILAIAAGGMGYAPGGTWWRIVELVLLVVAVGTFAAIDLKRS